MSTLPDIVQSYRHWAPVYDFVWGFVLGDGRAKLLAEVHALNPRRVLEMGVGTGLLLPKYPRAAQVTGVDISEEMLAHARRRSAAHGLNNVTLRIDDCERLAFQDHSFDCVVLPYVLSVTPDPDAMVREAIRVCHPDGRIVVVNHFSGSRTWALLEAVAAPIAAQIGFRTGFSYEENIERHPWRVMRATSANLFALSKVVVLSPNGAAGRAASP